MAHQVKKAGFLAVVTIPVLAFAEAVRVYDVDDYVQDGLLLHFDGIRNAGAAAAHDPHATTWANLGSLGSACDAVKTTATTTPNGAAAGAWVDFGYAFAGKEYFALGGTVALGEASTTQIRADYDFKKRISSYPVFFGAISKDKDTYVIYASKNNSGIFFKQNDANSIGENPWKPPYVTALYDVAGRRSSIASTLEPNWQTKTLSSIDGGNPLDFAIGTGKKSDNEKSVRVLVGTVHSVRVYDRVLASGEREWNRLVDESRFGGGGYHGVGNDVANVIVASNVEGVEGTEACGKWHVAEGVHTFTAPGKRFAGDCGYVLGGYTVETWDGTGWGTAVTNRGASYTASASGAKIRLTWQWTPVFRGKGGYDVDDYVQDALILHFDGIRNAGAAVAHDPDATVWKNLVPGPDAAKVTLAVTDDWRIDGTWADDGYVFGGKDYFAIGSALSLGNEVTVQSVIDRSDASRTPGVWASVFGATSNNLDDFVIYFAQNSIEWLYFKLFDKTSHKMESDWSPPYVTAIYNDADSKVSIDKEISAVWQTANTGVSGDLKELTYAIGTGKNTEAEKKKRTFKGTYHSLRVYTKVLNDAELKQNRRVDEMRYRGKGDVTVVNGAIGETGANGAGSIPDGAYNLESGMWTITAERVRIDGIVYTPQLLVETYDKETGKWVANTSRPVWAESYTIDKSELGEGRIRLVWTWKRKTGLAIIVR